jgi:hypothetical protein
VTGVSDCTARIWSVDPPKLVQILRGHKSVVSTIGWSHTGTKIITGSTDGTARLWDFDPKYKFWVCKHVLVMNPNEKKTTSQSQVTMVQFSLDDRYVLTAIQNSELKVWNAQTGQLVHVLKAHSRQIFVLDAHPTDPRIMLSAGYDGVVVLWNVETGQPVKIFMEAEHTMTDGGFSSNGSFGITDIEGCFHLYGTGAGDQLKRAPFEQFFANDYSPLMRDDHGYVIDEEHQIAPHLIPKRPLCDSYNRPYIDQPQPNKMAYINSHKYERAIIEEIRKQREAMAEVENKLAVVLSDNPMPFPEEMPPEPAPVNNRRRRAPENPFRAVPIPEDLLQGMGSDSEEDEEDDDVFEEAERDGVRRSSRLKTQRKLRRRLRKRSQRIRTRNGGAGEDGEEKSQEANNADEMEIVDSEYEFSDESNEDEMSLDSNDSAFEDDTDARALRRERRERQAAIDAVENSEDRGSRRTRRSAVSLGDRVRNKKLEKHKKKISSYPPWLTQTIPHSLIGSYSPQLRDRVVYFRQGHESYLNEFIEFSNLVPGEVPEVAYCTVKGIKFKVEPFIHCEILLETVIEADLREEYSLYNAEKPAESNINVNTNVLTEAGTNNNMETNNNTNAMETETANNNNNENSESERKSRKVITSPIATRSQRYRSDEDIVEKARRLSLLDVIRNMKQNNRIGAYNKTVPTKLEFTVHYHASELPDFLILASRFDQALSVDWQVGNRFRTWMFFQESEQTKQGSWYEGTIVDLSLNTLAKKRQRSLNNNNNDEIEPTLDVVDVPMTTSIAEVLPEAMLEHEEVADDTLLIEAKMPVSNNVNTNNVEEKAQPSEEVASAEKPIADSLIEEKTLEGASNNNNNSVAELMQAVEEKQPEPEKPVRISPVKIKIRVNSEANKEKEPEASADQNEIELINPWEMLVIKWDEDDDEDEEDHMSPWEVEQLDDAGKKTRTFTIETIDPDIAHLIIQEVQERILTMDEVDAFVEPVDVGQYDDYSDFVPCPMDVSTICDRLRNNYYRSIDQLKFDIQMIEGNAALYNEENSILVTYAKIIVRKFLDIVRHFEESLSSTSEPMATENNNVTESNTNIPVARAGGISTVRVVPNDQAYEELINKRTNRRRTRNERAEHPEATERENRRERRREREEHSQQHEERRTRSAAGRQLRRFVEDEGSEGGEALSDFEEDEASVEADEDDMDEDGYSDDEDSRGRRRRAQQRRSNTSSNNNRPRRSGRSIDDPTVNPYAQRFGVYSYGSERSNVHGFNDYRSTRSSSRIQQIHSERTQRPRSGPAPRVQTRSHSSVSANNTINNFNNNNNEGPRIRTLSDRGTLSNNNTSNNNNNNNRRITVRNLRSGRVLNEPHHEVQPFPSIRRDPTNPLVLRFNSQRRAAAEEASLDVPGRRTRNSLSSALDTHTNNNNNSEDEEDEEEEEGDDSGSEFDSCGRPRAGSNTRPTRTSARRTEVQEDQDDGVRRSSRKRKLNIMLESEDFLHDNEESSSANDPSKRRSGRLREKDFIKKSVEEAYPPAQREQHEEEYRAHVTTRRRAESLKEKSSEAKSESEEQIRPRATTRRRAGSYIERPVEGEEEEFKDESGPEEEKQQSGAEVKEEEYSTNAYENNVNLPTETVALEEGATYEPQTSSDPNELDPSLVEYFASRIRFVFPSAEQSKKKAVNRKRKRDSDEEEFGSGEVKRATSASRSNKRRKISEDEDEDEEVDEDDDFSESYDERPKKRQRVAPKSNASRSNKGSTRRAAPKRRANRFEDDDEDDMSDEAEDFDDDDDY